MLDVDLFGAKFRFGLTGFGSSPFSFFADSLYFYVVLYLKVKNEKNRLFSVGCLACDAGAVSGMPGERSTRAVALAALAILVVLGPHPLWADEAEPTTAPPFGK